MSPLRILCALTCMVLCLQIKAQNVSEQQLNTFLQTLAEKDKFMGVIHVSKNGKERYSNALGFAQLEQQKKAGPNTLYRVGSISKTLTATLVLLAVEEGKLQLTQTLDVYFPSIPNADRITIAQLLNHHSGIHNFTGDPGFMEWHTLRKTEDEMVNIIANGGSDFAPGAKAVYSNSNYVLLSCILQTAYGQPYGAILNEKIIAPLKLNHTTYGDERLADSNKTDSYTYEVGWNKVDDTHLSIPMGAGGILMSASDLARFVDALFDGVLLSKTSLALMTTQLDGYGMGIFKTQVFGKPSFTHDGKIDGFNSVYYYFPEEQVTYVLVSNAENYNLEMIHQAVLAYTFDEAYALPLLSTYELTEDDLHPYLGVYQSAESPLVINISQRGTLLLAQPEGQKIYTMEAVAKGQFKHDKSGVTLEFNPEEHTMAMQQGDQRIQFIRK